MGVYSILQYVRTVRESNASRIPAITNAPIVDNRRIDIQSVSFKARIYLSKCVENLAHATEEWCTVDVGIFDVQTKPHLRSPLVYKIDTVIYSLY